MTITDQTVERHQIEETLRSLLTVEESGADNNKSLREKLLSL